MSHSPVDSRFYINDSDIESDWDTGSTGAKEESSDVVTIPSTPQFPGSDLELAVRVLSANTPAGLQMKLSADEALRMVRLGKSMIGGQQRSS
jgi:hypothetical protein